MLLGAELAWHAAALPLVSAYFSGNLPSSPLYSVDFRRLPLRVPSRSFLPFLSLALQRRCFGFPCTVTVLQLFGLVCLLLNRFGHFSRAVRAEITFWWAHWPSTRASQEGFFGRTAQGLEWRLFGDLRMGISPEGHVASGGGLALGFANWPVCWSRGRDPALNPDRWFAQ